MAIEAERLVINLEARLNSFERDMRRAAGITDTNMRMIERRAQQAERSVQGSLKGLAAGITSGVGGALAGFGAAAFASSARDITRQIANIGNESRRAGLSSKAFQELSFVADQTRVPIDALIDGMKELSLRSDEFISTGAGPAAEAIKRLGFTADELKAKLKDPSALLVEIVGRLQRFDKAAQIRVADELFGGTGGERFVELLDKGSDGIQQMIRDANDFGLVMDDAMIAKADEVDRKFNLIATTIGTGLKKAIVNAGTALGEFLDQFKAVQDQQAGTLRTRIADNFKDQAALQGRIGDLKKEKSESYFPNLVQQQITLREGELAKLVAEYQELQSALDKYTGLAGDGLAKVGAAADTAADKLGQISTPAYTDRQTAAEVGSVYGGVVGDYVGNVVKAESGGNASAKNPNSSATGLGQFIESTWIDLFRKNFPALAATRADSNILKLRTDGAISRKLIEAYAQENAAILAKAGVSVDQAALHLAHFLGPGDAAKVLTAAPGTPLKGLVSQSSINANPTILGGERTVDDARAYADRRAGNTRRAAGNFTPDEETANVALERRNELVKEQVASYQELVAGATAFVSAQQLEATAVGQTAEQAAKLRYEQDLLNQASQAGLTITPQLRDQISQLAIGMAAAEEAALGLQESQASVVERMDAFRDGARDVLGGFISDLREGKSASEALGNALAGIADKLLESSLDSLIDGLFGKRGTSDKGSAGGFLARLGGFFDGSTFSFDSTRVAE